MSASYRHVDTMRVARLLQELSGDSAACSRFLLEFVDAWDGRLMRLNRAIARGDGAEVESALLSIRAASAMVGAEALEEAAAELLTQLRNGWPALPTLTIDRLEQLGAPSTRELSELATSIA